MSKFAGVSILLLRLSLGWVFLYSGISKIMSGTWSAAFYLKDPQTFPTFFKWFALPENIGWVTLLNEWGMLLIGISLITGALVRWSSIAGAVMVLLYYLPILKFPYAGEHSYIVDDHIVYMFVFIMFAAVRAGEYYGLDKYICRSKKNLY